MASPSGRGTYRSPVITYRPVSKHSPCNRPRTASIHILDNDSLLNVFYLYRPFLLGEDQDEKTHLSGGKRGWVRGRWWYKLAHVCQRWRNVILGSTSYLELSLVCTYGTPVADMLAFSPPFPLVVDYSKIGRNITTDDEEGIILALKQRDRVLRVRLNTHVNLQKFIATMDEEYPILEHLVIELPIKDNSMILTFPGSLQASNLRHLRLQGFALPIGSQLLTTAVGLVTLSLMMVHPSTYFHPNTLLQWISLMPQLKMLAVDFEFSVPNSDVERQPTPAPIIAPAVTLPDLRYFEFHGVSIYLEALVHRITSPRLKELKIDFFNQLTFSVPRLLRFMIIIPNFTFNSTALTFSDKKVNAVVYPRGEKEIVLGIVVRSWHFDWRVSSMAQISNSLGQMLSAVEHLTLQHRVHHDNQPSEEQNEVDAPSGADFLGRLATRRPFRSMRGSSGISLAACNWRMESSL